VTDRPARLLYIDDDPGLCRLVERTLPRRGFTVETAHGGDEGVRKAAAGDYDIVAVDHFMPGLDGFDTLAALRALPNAPPVVYVTGADESRLAVAALKAGAADYVVKSASEDFLDLLASALGQALDQVKLRRERDAAAAELSQANARLEAVVQRQAMLLREVNHRVANSLQLVSSFVHLQAQQVKDSAAAGALRDTQARILAIMQVHRRLYTSEDIHTVDAADYLRGLLTELEQSLSSEGAPRPIRLEAAAVELDTDQAVSLGVVVAELVTNAHKYAYAPQEEGEIRVRLSAEPEHTVRLEVEDDGVGFAPAAAPKGTGLGQKVVAAMARSLGGALAYDPAYRGSRAVLRFQT
jgi:two-component sensor histidine kinase